jgi:NAD(P)-dependent dehydrogenase (short-subunit alcohol dehydrogenase family)
MFDKGARNLVFLSRSGAQKEEAQNLIKELARQGARVAVYACDLSDENRLKVIIEEVTRDFPCIRGVIQGAMVLQVSLRNLQYFLCDETTYANIFRIPRLRV